jgi:preprotein translocase subunit SecA
MLNVLDEKWKDHLYDLDQLRGAIHYRSWGQKDPLIEYKQEAYTMFVDLMGDIHTTFTERFLRAQLVFNAPPSPQPASGPDGDMGQRRPQRRYNALGVLEDIPAEEHVAEATNGAPDTADGDGAHRAPEPARAAAPVRQDPTIVGAGRAKKLSDFEGGKGTALSGGGTGLPKGEIDWSSVGRNDPCPCGSGKKYKKCHGA